MFAVKDYDGYIGLYSSRPVRGEFEWFASTVDTVNNVELSIPLPLDMYDDFEFLRWEDDPVEVVVIPKKYKKDEQ